MSKQPTDPTTGRVIPTRETVAEELKDLLATMRFTGQTVPIEIEADSFKALVSYVMQREADNYKANVNLGIGIGRREVATMLEALLDKKTTYLQNGDDIHPEYTKGYDAMKAKVKFELQRLRKLRSKNRADM